MQGRDRKEEEAQPSHIRPHTSSDPQTKRAKKPKRIKDSKAGSVPAGRLLSATGTAHIKE
ncbi:MAG: hypothetical protein JWQ58_1007 [Reyranella sp.]|nr:hypothetical protein [Reyranella sp.]